MVALSVSISTRTSPISTRSPGCLCQVAMAPSSIVSDRRGILISIMALTNLLQATTDGLQRLEYSVHDVVVGRHGRRFENLGIRHGYFGHRHTAHGCVEVVECAIGDRRGNLRSDPVGQPVVL